MPRALSSKNMSMMGSSRMEKRNHCGQYHVHNGSYPMWGAPYRCAHVHKNTWIMNPLPVHNLVRIKYRVTRNAHITLGYLNYDTFSNMSNHLFYLENNVNTQLHEPHLRTQTFISSHLLLFVSTNQEVP
jgi:hypothetical protein